jgi:hypothetical protein
VLRLLLPLLLLRVKARAAQPRTSSPGSAA